MTSPPRSATVASADEAAARTVRRGDLIAAENAFIDCRTPGCEKKKLNYSIIGSGVSETDQFINLEIPHGYQLGGASLPPGVNNSLHMHFTAEVFIVAAGTFTFRWGRHDIEGEYVGHVGDIISVPTWVFRGFTNTGGDDNFIFTVLGQDETGGLIWEPDVLRRAEGYGLDLTIANKLVDTVAGDALTDDIELVAPMPEEQIARMRAYSVDDMRGRVTANHDRQFSAAAFLCTTVPGGAARLALAIGYGLTEDRLQESRVHNPHGFSVAALRADRGQGVLRHRHDESQVLIVLDGEWQVTLSAVSGYRPPGTYAPLAMIGMCFCPRWIPGAVSISTSASVSRCTWAKRRTLLCTVSMSSMTWAGTSPMMRSTAAGSSRNDPGDQWSKRSEYSRTAASPRSRMSAMIPRTVSETCSCPADTAAAAMAVFR